MTFNIHSFIILYILFCQGDDELITDFNFTTKLIRYFFSGLRENFTLEEDSYHHWVLLTVVEGSFSYEIKGQHGDASFGDLIFCPPGTPLRRQTINPVVFHFLEFSFQDDREKSFATEEVIPFGKTTIRDLNRLSSTFSYLKNANFTNHSVKPNPFAIHLLYDLLHLVLLERYSTPPSHRIDDPLIQRAVQHLEKDVGEDVTMQTLAENLGIDPSQFTRRFKALTGKTPVDYRTDLRLQQARKLLLETDRTLEDIAIQCGYQNGFYLSRVFSKKMNISPSSFRKTHRV